MLDALLQEEQNSFDIAAALLKLYLKENKMMDNHQELDMVDTQKKFKTSSTTTRLHINIGKNKGFSPRHLLTAVFQETGLSKKLIGNIDVFDSFTFMEVQSDYADTVIEGLTGKKLKGQKVRVERASEKKKKRK